MRTLLVDADPQPDATLAVGVNPARHDFGGHFVDAVTWGDPLRVVPAKDRLDVVVSGREVTRLARAPLTEPEAPQVHSRLRSRRRPLRPHRHRVRTRRRSLDGPHRGPASRRMPRRFRDRAPTRPRRPQSPRRRPRNLPMRHRRAGSRPPQDQRSSPHPLQHPATRPQNRRRGRTPPNDRRIRPSTPTKEPSKEANLLTSTSSGPKPTPQTT